MRGTTGNILQPHKILRLPRDMNLMLNSLHTCNAIYTARNDRQHPPTSPNIAPATKNESHGVILFTHETLFTMRGAAGNVLQPHQILRLPRKMNFMLNSLHT